MKFVMVLTSLQVVQLVNEKDFGEVVLENRLKFALQRINDVSDEVIDEAIRKITIPQNPQMLVNVLSIK